MAPPRGTKRKSNESASMAKHVGSAHNTAADKIATEPVDAHHDESPRKRQKTTGISMAQKQALIDNLQLEITERARKLRAQYNLQAQGLRTRIEIRVNRIPMALRTAKMGELADKHASGQQQAKPTPSFPVHSAPRSTRPPPVPEKDTPMSRPISTASVASHSTAASRPGPGRPPKRTSNEISKDANEKDAEAKNAEVPKKKARGNPPATEAEATTTSKVLSPSSANIRTMTRPMPSGKPLLIRATPANENGTSQSPTKSPIKKSSASNLFHSWAEKARSPRKNAASKGGDKASVSSTASSAPVSTKGKKASTASSVGTAKGAVTVKTRRISGISESSESSTSTVVKKSASKAEKEKKETATTGKRGRVMGTIRRGVAGAGSKKAAAAPTATGRVLRKRKE